ncbi:polyprenol phosphomannose-dependent alpha 1,6 mannosyltransferase MptB [Tessaracoccus sp. MC1627]|uniref:polyprenol phosphomannose-dependent alpha 1,6 mannosyltransferase MptB n=1 Tax=Tessaracoccus sp. MC1627 TaxID=2760312 RepID=UPI0016033F66|nr:polyprenol phosphomannose-dependent alpha 1,6 mannosyltransferase MptB [Tessaracoccus sp. MC1627]
MTLAAWLRPTPHGRPVHPWWWITAGLLAVLILVGAQFADAPGLLERGDSWWRPLVSLPALSVLVLAWWQLGPLWRHPLVAAAIWSAPMMFALPMYSRDAYAYAAQGWMVARGLDPYTTPLGEAGLPGLLVGVHWHKTTAVYPALSLELFGMIARLTGSDLFWTTVALRVPNVLALIGLAWVVRRLARRFGVDVGLALWAGVLNPIMLVQWIGGVHNDAFMVTLAVAAVLAVTDLGWRGWRGLLVAGVLLGLAMGVKQTAAVYGLGVVAVGWAARFPHGLAPPTRDGAAPAPSPTAGWWRLAVVAAVPGAVTIAVFALVSLRFGFGWGNPTAGNPIGAMSNAPLSWLAEALRYPLPDDVVNPAVTTVSTVLLLAAFVALWVRIGPRGDDPRRPWAFMLAVLAAFCVLGPALQPWYLTMLLPLYVFWLAGPRWDRAWLVVVVGFTLLPALQTLVAPLIAMPLLAVPLWWLWSEMSRRGVSPLPPRSSLR